ncbi:hypothetical protein, partial [Enterococcus faecalis]|uniref:hypothetical protein n=1 Tax=Enterococcus faecalis TaxID=1351 RepID=UPI00224403C6
LYFLNVERICLQSESLHLEGFFFYLFLNKIEQLAKMIVPIVALNISREKIPGESKLKVCKTNKKHKKNSKQANSFPK